MVNSFPPQATVFCQLPAPRIKISGKPRPAPQGWGKRMIGALILKQTTVQKWDQTIALLFLNVIQIIWYILVNIKMLFPIFSVFQSRGLKSSDHWNTCCILNNVSACTRITRRTNHKLLHLLTTKLALLTRRVSPTSPIRKSTNTKHIWSVNCEVQLLKI